MGKIREWQTLATSLLSSKNNFMSEEKKVLLRLSDLAIALKMNKSRLTYYASLELFPAPEHYGSVATYDKDEVLRRLKIIEHRKRKGKTLAEIKRELDEDNL